MRRILIVVILLGGMLARQGTSCQCALAPAKGLADNIKSCSQCQNCPKSPPATPRQAPTPCGKCQVSKHFYSSPDSNPPAEPLTNGRIDLVMQPQSVEQFFIRGQSRLDMPCGQTGIVVQRE